MAVPKRRISSTKRNMRRSHHARQRLQLVPCPRCQQPVVGHTACPNCGTYKGREVIDIATPTPRRKNK